MALKRNGKGSLGVNPEHTGELPHYVSVYGIESDFHKKAMVFFRSIVNKTNSYLKDGNTKP